MLKKHRVVILQTNQKASFGVLTHNNEFIYPNKKGWDYITTRDYIKGYHLYILSDDEIKLDDWYFSHGNKSEKYSVHKCDTERLVYICNESNVAEYCNKIIASTNPDLKLPLPSNAFIQKYCEMNGNIDEVMVEYKQHVIHFDNYKGRFYDEWIPKVSSDNTITIKPVKDSFTRNEVIQILDAYDDYLHYDVGFLPEASGEDWFNENY